MGDLGKELDVTDIEQRFVGVSTQTSLVLDFIAARTASTSDTGAGGVYSIPHCVKTLSMRRKVPPYASSGGMTR